MSRMSLRYNPTAVHPLHRIKSVRPSEEVRLRLQPRQLNERTRRESGKTMDWKEIAALAGTAAASPKLWEFAKYLARTMRHRHKTDADITLAKIKSDNEVINLLVQQARDLRDDHRKLEGRILALEEERSRLLISLGQKDAELQRTIGLLGDRDRHIQALEADRDKQAGRIVELERKVSELAANTSPSPAQ